MFHLFNAHTRFKIINDEPDSKMYFIIHFIIWLIVHYLIEHEMSKY